MIKKRDTFFYIYKCTLKGFTFSKKEDIPAMDNNIFINGILHQLFTDNTYMPDEDTLQLLQKQFNNNCFTITAFRLSANKDYDTYKRELSLLIPRYAQRHCNANVWFYRTECHDNLLIFNHDSGFDVAGYINEIHTYFIERHNCNSCWGISRLFHTLAEFIFAGKEAVISLEKSHTNNNTDIVLYNNNMSFPVPDTFKYYYPETAANILYKAIKHNNHPAIDFIINTLSDENLIVRTLNSVEILKFHNAVTSTFMLLNPSKYNFSDILIHFNQEMIKIQDNPGQYFMILLNVCHKIANELDNHKSSRKKLPIQNIQAYILSNYNDANLNLAGTAHIFNVSEGYLSSSFKDSLGICFAEYLENIRIEKSCELLKSSSCTILDIAEKTGYNSVYSFRRAFKRIMHTSPSDYRIKHCNE